MKYGNVEIQTTVVFAKLCLWQQTILRKPSYVVLPRNVKVLHFVFNYLRIYSRKKNKKYPLPRWKISLCSIYSSITFLLCIYIRIYLPIEIHSFIGFKFLHKFSLTMHMFCNLLFSLTIMSRSCYVSYADFFVFSHISLWCLPFKITSDSP